MYIAIPAILAAVLLGLGYRFAGSFFLVVGVFMLYFFRDPTRRPPSEPDVVVSPADGRVTRVSTLTPEEESSSTLVSIFLSPLDVHINRSPIAGMVTDVS